MPENSLSSQDKKYQKGTLSSTKAKEKDDIDVKPEMLQAHLMLLTKFKALEQADEQIDHDIWVKNNGHTDPESESIWVKNTKQPWVLDPNDNSNFKMKCPWCKDIIQIPWKNYVKLMQNIETDEKCLTCKASLSVETLSCKRFIDDIVEWNKDKTKFIGGTLVDLKDGSCSELFALNNSSLLFSTDDSDIKYLTVSKSLTWEHIINELDNHVNQLKKITVEMKKKIKIIVQRTVFAYNGIPFPFSIDLIGAVFRQREFTEKMVNNKMINRTEVQANATIRYLKFLFLMKEKQKTILVPTLDIDLCWHTHQIHASLYREFTKKHIGRIINHDDTLTEGALSDGFAATARAWYKKYREPYTHDDPSKIWLTAKKKIISVIMPPYGLLVRNQLKKYKKSFTNQHEKDIKIYNVDVESVESVKTVEIVESVKSEKGKEKMDISSKYPNDKITSQEPKEKITTLQKSAVSKASSKYPNDKITNQEPKEKTTTLQKSVVSRASSKYPNDKITNQEPKEKTTTLQKSVVSRASSKYPNDKITNQEPKEKTIPLQKSVVSKASPKYPNDKITNQEPKEKIIPLQKSVVSKASSKYPNDKITNQEPKEKITPLQKSVASKTSSKYSNDKITNQEPKEKITPLQNPVVSTVSPKYPNDKITNQEPKEKIIPLQKSVVSRASSKYPNDKITNQKPKEKIIPLQNPVVSMVSSKYPNDKILNQVPKEKIIPLQKSVVSRASSKQKYRYGRLACLEILSEFISEEIVFCICFKDTESVVSAEDLGDPERPTNVAVALSPLLAQRARVMCEKAMGKDMELVVSAEDCLLYELLSLE
ncbi:2075_t:CDS:2 [Diversispora eburnea]|uniref:2075_t:CDS:1 n=1 Tax=Diversispora eburnea TaxID=1213867 RepID=A0A9N9AC47_9GLOM|nr:2075_t:CDS:2 [Diversispora eburnea]